MLPIRLPRCDCHLVRRAMSALIARSRLSPRAMRGVRIGTTATTLAGRGNKRNTRSANRIVHIVDDKQCLHGTAAYQRDDLVSQTGSKGIVARRQRLVDDEEIRFDRERAGETRRTTPRDSSPRNGCDVRSAPELRIARTVLLHPTAARQVALFLRPTAKATAAAPETQYLSVRPAGQATRP